MVAREFKGGAAPVLLPTRKTPGFSFSFPQETWASSHHLRVWVSALNFMICEKPKVTQFQSVLIASMRHLESRGWYPSIDNLVRVLPGKKRNSIVYERRKILEDGFYKISLPTKAVGAGDLVPIFNPLIRSRPQYQIEDMVLEGIKHLDSNGFYPSIVALGVLLPEFSTEVLTKARDRLAERRAYLIQTSCCNPTREDLTWLAPIPEVLDAGSPASVSKRRSKKDFLGPCADSISLFHAAWRNVRKLLPKVSEFQGEANPEQCLKDVKTRSPRNTPTVTGVYRHKSGNYYVLHRYKNKSHRYGTYKTFEEAKIVSERTKKELRNADSDPGNPQLASHSAQPDAGATSNGDCQAEEIGSGHGDWILQTLQYFAGDWETASEDDPYAWVMDSWSYA